MHYYKAKIQYDGTNYCGFQWQSGLPTIQNDLNLSIKKIVTGKVSTVGASRTDKGVHAFEQFVKITSENPIDFEKLKSALPAQIKCLMLEQCEGSFKPISNCTSKEYRYFFTNQIKSPDLDPRFIPNNPYPLDLNLMKSCLQKIIGTHDFKNFSSAGSNVTTTQREITLCELNLINPHQVFHGQTIFKISNDIVSCYELRIQGNGFLKQMIRHLMSGLWLVGNGRFKAQDFIQLIDGDLREKRLWKVASPKGLFLYRINYK